MVTGDRDLAELRQTFRRPGGRAALTALQRHLGHAGMGSQLEGTGPLSPQTLLTLQRSVGNRALGRLLSPTLTVQREFEDQGKVAVGDFAGKHPAEAAVTGSVSLPVNAEGFIDGEVQGTVTPHAFINAGKIAAGTWHHAGGTGGKGNEDCGALTSVAPTLMSAPPKGGKPATAWVQMGTGKIKVSRSYNGVPTGANGNFTDGTGSVYITSKASNRMDKHELEHVKKSKELHNTHLKPTLKQVSKYGAKVHSNATGTTELAAKASLTTILNWNKAIQDFTAADIDANSPMLQVDLDDMARAPDFYDDYGPKKVKGTDYDHYYDYPCKP